MFFISFYHNTKKARWFEIVEEIKSGYQKTLEKWHWAEDLKKFGRDRNEARDMILTSRRERKWSWFSIPLIPLTTSGTTYLFKSSVFEIILQFLPHSNFIAN